MARRSGNKRRQLSSLRLAVELAIITSSGNAHSKGSFGGRRDLCPTRGSSVDRADPRPQPLGTTEGTRRKGRAHAPDGNTRSPRRDRIARQNRAQARNDFLYLPRKIQRRRDCQNLQTGNFFSFALPRGGGLRPRLRGGRSAMVSDRRSVADRQIRN